MALQLYVVRKFCVYISRGEWDRIEAPLLYIMFVCAGCWIWWYTCVNQMRWTLFYTLYLSWRSRKTVYNTFRLVHHIYIYTFTALYIHICILHIIWKIVGYIISILHLYACISNSTVHSGYKNWTKIALTPQTFRKLWH